MALPDVLTIDGVDYIRDELARRKYATEAARPESFCRVYDLAEEFGINVHRIYAALNDGSLPYRIAPGTSRPKMVRRSDFIAWTGGWETQARRS